MLCLPIAIIASWDCAIPSNPGALSPALSGPVSLLSCPPVCLPRARPRLATCSTLRPTCANDPPLNATAHGQNHGRWRLTGLRLGDLDIHAVGFAKQCCA